jgi:hypothetical protein
LLLNPLFHRVAQVRKRHAGALAHVPVESRRLALGRHFIHSFEYVLQKILYGLKFAINGTQLEIDSQ